MTGFCTRGLIVSQNPFTVKTDIGFSTLICLMQNAAGPDMFYVEGREH